VSAAALTHTPWLVRRAPGRADIILSFVAIDANPLAEVW
jgi:hypothetical protein